jgi:hypothetical protein
LDHHGGRKARERDAKVVDSAGLYAAILEAPQGQSLEGRAALNARLVLLLANHIGDASVVREALATARASLAK